MTSPSLSYSIFASLIGRDKYPFMASLALLNSVRYSSKESGKALSDFASFIILMKFLSAGTYIICGK